MIRIRVDDFPNTKDGEKDRHSLAAFRAFDLCLRGCIGGKRYLLGVIPGRCSVEDVLFLRNETDCVVGMHGINHDEAKLDIYQNEFPPFLSQDEIRRQMVEAGGALEDGLGRDIHIYMPPRNQIDLRTVHVLESIDAFTHFTTGPETSSELRVDARVMQHIHSEPPHEYGRTDELLVRGSHEILMQRAATQDVVLTLHWTWECNLGLQYMVKFFSMIPKRYFGDFNV